MTGLRETSADTTGATSLRILQVGMGGFGRGWAADVIPTVEGVELVGAVDVSQESLDLAREVTSLPEDRYFLSLSEALDAVEADAVLVTTTVEYHIPVAMAALDRGLHVLTEKPFAPTLADAERAVEAAERSGLVLQVSQNYRFFPAVRAVRDLVASGDLGALDSVTLEFRRYDNTAPREGHRHYSVPQPLLVDMSIHHFDLMRAVIGQEPVEIYTHSWNPPWSKFEEPPEATAIVRFDGGVPVTYHGSWLSSGPDTPWAGDWRMNFSEGEVWWTSRGGVRGNPLKEDVVMVSRRGEEPIELPLPSMEHLDRAGSLQAFKRAIETGREPETSGRANLPTLALTLAAVQSAAEGAPVAFGARQPVGTAS